MLTPQQLSSLQPSNGQGQSVPLNDDSFKQWLGSSPAPAQPEPNIAQKAIGTFLDPIISGATRTGQAVGTGIMSATNAIAGKPVFDIQKGLDTPTTNPLTGTPLNAPSKDTAEQIAGRGLSTVALGIPGTAAAGAALGLGSAMEQNKGIGSSAIDTVAGAIGGKILEHGFNAVAPYVEKAAMNLGKPFIDKISQYVPDSAKSFMESLGSKIGGVTDAKVLPQAASDAIDKGANAVSNAAQKPFDAAGNATSKMYDAITGKGAPSNVDAFITKNFNKGVRPSVSGKNTSTQMENSDQKAIGAVKTIVENKPNLQLMDENGHPTNKLPTNLKEFADSIDQTKQQLFKQYDSLSKQAGETGAKIDLSGVSGELNKVANDPVMVDNHPEIAKYAQARADALTSRGSYTPEQAQQAIQLYNKSLDAFYKNPSYDTASKASVDAMIANQMRSELDSTIEKNTSPGYQELKNKYGQLKSIEKDVVHRAIVDGRKNEKGLLDFANIGSAAELMRGLVTMNPADIATSAVVKGVAKYYRYLNDPNTSIERMFSGAEKASGQGIVGNRPSIAKAPKSGE
jgi:hypothetical protein